MTTKPGAGWGYETGSSPEEQLRKAADDLANAVDVWNRDRRVKFEEPMIEALGRYRAARYAVAVFAQPQLTEEDEAKIAELLGRGLKAEVGGTVKGRTWVCVCGVADTEKTERDAAIALWGHRKAQHGA